MSETPSTPGSLAMENLKKRDAALAVFKKPLAQSKKPKQKILTEEKYIEELSKIVQRDFFPDLDRLRAQNDYLDAMDRKDYEEMEAIRVKYSMGRQPSERVRLMTPATFETPVRTGNMPGTESVPDTPKSTTSLTSKAEGSRNTLSEKHSLDSFLQSYTSEDNYSFQEIIDTADRKLRQKFAVLYNEEHLSTENLMRALTLPSIEQQFEEPDPMRKIETWTYTNKNSIMYIPDGVELTKAERIESANCKQSIQYSATRLSVNPFDEDSSQKTVSDIAKTQSEAASGRIGVDGNAQGLQGKPAPQIRGFDLLKTPSPRPGVAFSPLMTWGEIEGTPFRLDGSDTPVRSNAGPSFKINETSRRENIALALAEKVGEKMRAQKQRAMNTARKNISSPFTRSNTERLASMSPAARHLATTKLGLRASLMTPSPLLTPASAKHGRVGSRGAYTKKTPSKSGSTPTTLHRTPTRIVNNSGGGKSTLTDDLLKIPKPTQRAKASDFF